VNVVVVLNAVNDSLVMRKNYSLIIQFATAILNCSDVCQKGIIGNGQQTFDWQREDKLIDKAKKK
jgi:hypothetical protein